MDRINVKLAGCPSGLVHRVGDKQRIDTESARRRREPDCSPNQAGRNLTVHTTIDMARTQTWTGGD